MKRVDVAYVPDENGELQEKTNLIIPEEGDVTYTKKQRDFYFMKLQQTEAQKDYGPFVWMLYHSGEGIFDTLTQSTVTRLIYMSTFLGYDGYLVHDNYKTLTKEQLKKRK